MNAQTYHLRSPKEGIISDLSSTFLLTCLCFRSRCHCLLCPFLPPFLIHPLSAQSTSSLPLQTSGHPLTLTMQSVQKSPPMPHPSGQLNPLNASNAHQQGHDFVSNPLLFPSNPHVVPGWGGGGGRGGGQGFR